MSRKRRIFVESRARETGLRYPTNLLRVSAACNEGTIDSHCSAVTAVMLRQAASDDSAANTAPSAATKAVKRHRLDDI